MEIEHLDTGEMSIDTMYLRESPLLGADIGGGLLKMPLDALQIQGRFTPIPPRSHNSTRSSSLNSSAHNSRRSSYCVPDDLEYDNEPENMSVAPKAKNNSLTVTRTTAGSGRTTPVFTWSPLPLRKKGKATSELDLNTVESEVDEIYNTHCFP